MKVLRSVFICMFIVVSTLYVWNYLELRESRSESEGLSSQNTQLFKNLDDQENMLANQIQETERIHVQLELVTRELNNNISQNKALISKLGVFSDQLDYQVAETVDLTEEFETVKIELTDIRKILEDKIDENTILTHNLKKTNAELAGKIDKNITLRTRKPGDRFQPLGMTHSKKLQDFMVDAKIPSQWRDRIPLITSAKGIAWIAGFRIAEWAKVTENTDEILEIRLKANSGTA